MKMCLQGLPPLRLQVVKYLGRIVRQFAEDGAGAQLWAVAAGGVAFPHDALAYLTEFAAIVGLAPFGAAAHAVDGFGGDERFVV